MITEIVRVARSGAEPKQCTILANVTDEGGASEADEEDEDHAGLAPGNPLKRKRESILRPKSNKAAKKYTSRRQSADEKQSARAKLDEDSDSDTSGGHDAGDDNVVNNDAADAAVDNSQTDDAETENPEAVTLKVKHRVRAPKPEEVEPVVSYVPTYRKVKAPATVPVVRVWTDRANNLLPSYYEPQGPGNTWTCPYGGCSYKVWEAREGPSIEMIKEHFVDTHAGKAADLVNEERRPWTSVE